MSKKNIRQIICQKRLSIEVAQQNALSKKICQNIQQSSMYKSSQKIGLYMAIQNEVNLNELLLDKDKDFYLPVVQLDWKLNFYHFKQNDKLIQNRKLLEPIPKEKAIKLDELDLILIPLIAFDKKGHRIGSGKGCYDRTFKNTYPCPILIGIAYSFQEIKEVKYEPHDIQMNYVITESHCYHCA